MRAFGCMTRAVIQSAQMLAYPSVVSETASMGCLYALQDSIRRSGVVPVSGSVPSVGMGWMIVLTGMAIPMAGMGPERCP